MQQKLSEEMTQRLKNSLSSASKVKNTTKRPEVDRGIQTSATERSWQQAKHPMRKKTQTQLRKIIKQ